MRLWRRYAPVSYTHLDVYKRPGLDKALYARSRVNKVVPPDIPERVAPMIITWRETLSYVQRVGIRKGMRVLLSLIHI